MELLGYVVSVLNFGIGRLHNLESRTVLDFHGLWLTKSKPR